MANKFVAVPAEALESWLKAHGFSERRQQGNEVVFFRRSSRNPDVRIEVFSSIRVGQVAVRDAGKDSIKVCAIFENSRGKRFPVQQGQKLQPVFRVTSVESVLSRLKERLKEAAELANKWIDENEKKFAERDALRRDDAVGDRAWKNEFSRREARQESAAVLMDPDFQDPCSEPPEALFAMGGGK